MRLNRPRNTSSFFESFSDLIFATMAIFVMLLIVFISQQGESEARINYTGRSGSTYSLISHLEQNGTPSVLFFPVEVADRLNLYRSREINDPLLLLAEAAVTDGGLATMPIDEYIRMADGVSREFALGIRSQGEGTIEGALLLENLPAATAGVTAAQLKAQVFGAETLKVLGAGTGEERITLPDNQRDRYRAIGAWLQSQKRGDFHSWVRYSRQILRDQAAPDPDGRAVVRWSLRPDGRIRIGSASLDEAQFRGFLGSINAGANFALVYVNEEGQPGPPPAAVVQSVLVPAGFGAAY